MLFWDLIRDFFVRYIFGGTTSSGELIEGVVGTLTSFDSENLPTSVGSYGTGGIFVNIGTIFGEDIAYQNMSGGIYLGDWLSTTATIISMVGICIGLFMLIRWFFKIGAGFIGLRG